MGEESGVFSCLGCSGGGEECDVAQVNFFVTTVADGFQISGPDRAIEGDKVELVCAASRCSRY